MNGPWTVLRIMPGWRGTPIAVDALAETRRQPAKTPRLIELLRNC
ncbi:hypothetical protein HDG33_003536 [Paraburkholderia sp. Cpub6]|nr:hypothetical protein [Paraburkholderia sp. Cpub6]